jgi:hypothetical protein
MKIPYMVVILLVEYCVKTFSHHHETQKSVHYTLHNKLEYSLHLWHIPVAVTISHPCTRLHTGLKIILNAKESSLKGRAKQVLRCVLVLGCLDVAGCGCRCERLFMLVWAWS